MEGSNWLNGVSDAEVIPKTASIVVALAKDPALYQYILSLIPTQEQLQESHERHQSAYNAALGGTPEQILEHQKERQVLNGRFSTFTGLIRLAAVKDPTLPRRFGMSQSKPKKASIATLASPSKLKAVHGSNSKEIMLKASPVKGAKSYFVEICDRDPSVEANWRFACVSTAASKIEVKGLTPGTVYWFRVRGVGAHGHGAWSQYVSLMSM